MKKIILTFMAFIAFGIAHAQQGEIIYREPNLTKTISLALYPNGDHPRFKMDIDQDGQNEWQFDCDEAFRLVCLLRFSPVALYYEDWTLSFAFWSADSDTLHYGDILTDINVWASPVLGGTWLPYTPPEWGTPTQRYWPSAYVAVRRKIDEGSYCYGWLEVEVEYAVSGNYITLTLKRHAYCTVPNYPLCIGQTGFDWGTTEVTHVTAFATVHPNPATGIVTIMGKNLAQAEVFNTLGQQVATATGEGETLHIDIANLPAGIYFVSVTDAEGRKCVKRVVKE